MDRCSCRRYGIPAAVVLLSAFLSGCSAFQSTRQIDMNPFAENTAAMFAEAAKVGRPARLNYLKVYANAAEFQEYRRRARPVIRGLRGIVMYSNQLVALNMSQKSDKEKNKFLAAYFRDAESKIADRKIFDSLGISPTMMDTVYVNIERAPTFREGIEAASPLVNAVVLAMQHRLDEIEEGAPAIIGALDEMIEADYASKRRNYDNLVRLQAQYQYAATLLYDGKSGDREALRKLLETDPSMRDFFAVTDKPSAKEFDAGEIALSGRLERIDTYIHQLADEKAMYVAKQQELETLRLNFDERIKLARDAIMVWAQFHRNLGAGIAVPPLIDVAGIAGGLAKKVVPLP